MVLRSVNVGVIASLFTIGAVPRPSGLGVQVGGKHIVLFELCQKVWCPACPFGRRMAAMHSIQRAELVFA